MNTLYDKFLSWSGLDFWQMVLVFAALALWYFVYRAGKDETTPFRFADVFIENGKTSLKRFCAMGAFFASTWVVLHQEAKGRLDAEIFGVYMFGWVLAYTAPALIGKWRTGNTAANQ